MGISERVYSEERMDFFTVQYFMEKHLFDRWKLFLVDFIQPFFMLTNELSEQSHKEPIKTFIYFSKLAP